MIRQLCGGCGNEAVSSMGTSKDHLIVLSQPTERDEEIGLPFSISRAYNTAGFVMRQEMNLVRLDLADFRVAMLWLHKPNDEEACFSQGWDNVLENSKDKKSILLVGQEAVNEFTGYDASDVNGLQVESAHLHAPLIYALINPTNVFSGGVGEFRFGIQEFAKALRGEQ